MRRSLLWGLVAWVLVVALASGVTWAVIDRAGQTVLSGDVPLITAPDLPAGRQPPTPSAAPESAAVSPSSSPPAEPSSPGSSRPAVTTSSAPPARTTGSVERSWEGEPGTVLVRCTGSVADLRSATPSDDYRVDVESRGPREIEVKFKGGGSEIKVKAKCDEGVPRFRTEGDSPEEGDHD